MGSLKPNAFGLFDMLGNVSEWCLDIYTKYRSAAADEPLDGRVIDVSHYMAERGEGYSDPVRTIRSANRRPTYPQMNVYPLGFRIARTLEPNK